MIPHGNRTKIPFETFLARARATHGEKYEYDESGYYAGQRLTIVCKKHGQFVATRHNHLGGSGCAKCWRERSSLSRFKTTNMFVAEAKRLHGDKYDYSQAVYRGAHANLTIVCPIHGPFEQTASNHTNNGCGCTSCGRANRVPSGGEYRISEWLTEHGIAFEKEKSYPDLISPSSQRHRLRYDFFLPQRRLIVEFDGEHHFSPIRISKYGKELAQKRLDFIKLKDKIKSEYAAKIGIPILRISFHEDIEAKLASALKARRRDNGSRFINFGSKRP